MVTAGSFLGLIWGMCLGTFFKLGVYYLWHRTIVADCAAALKKLQIMDSEPYTGGELRVFFVKLSSWLLLPITLIFVFEKAEINNPWWRSLARDLIQYFRYYSIEVQFMNEISLNTRNLF